MSSRVDPLRRSLARIRTLRRMSARRTEQILRSLPHYMAEVTRLRSPAEARTWLHYKLPWFSAPPDFPDKLQIETTNHCNLGCVHCHRTLPGRSEGFMELALFASVLDELRSHPNCSVKLVGLGEPALHPQFREMMELARETPTKFTVYTNGTLLISFPIDEVLDWKLDHIVVSIDGTDANSYAAVRRGGDYARLRKSVTEFVRLRAKRSSRAPLIEIRHVILPNESREQLDAFREDWKQIADTVKFNYVIVPRRSGHDELPGPFKECRDILREAYVRWDGRMPLCGYQFLYADQEWLGDVRDASIQELWMHPRLQEVRRLHTARTLDAVPFCKGCESC